MTFEDLARANASISTMGIERRNKETGKVETRQYAEVNQRIKAFRMCYPEGFIFTEIDSLVDGVCLMTARVGFYDGADTVILGIGHAYEKENSSYINKTSYIENCETSAVGRALGMAGFGIDTSFASYEEVANAMKNQNPPSDTVTISVEGVSSSKVNEIQVAALLELIETTHTDAQKVMDSYKVKSLDDMTMGQWKQCMDILTKRKDGQNTTKG